MKTLKNIILTLFVVAGLLTSCVNEDEVNQDRPGGSAGTPRLDLVISDDAGAVVAGASIAVFANEDDYITEQNSIANGTTDASGVASFTPAELGGEAGTFYFSVSSGNQRNWASTIVTPYMYLTAGPTRISTTVADVLPEFITLIDRPWNHFSYTNGDAEPACNTDDVFTFLKTGNVLRTDGATVCDPVRTVPLPGVAWSPWSTDGTNLTIADYDPWYFNNGRANAVGGGPMTLTDTQLVIDFGGGYVWTLTR